MRNSDTCTSGWMDGWMGDGKAAGGGARQDAWHGIAAMPWRGLLAGQVWVQFFAVEGAQARQCGIGSAATIPAPACS
eukprot:211733-Chlamydomonas_euryale.AAC.1